MKATQLLLYPLVFAAVAALTVTVGAISAPAKTTAPSDHGQAAGHDESAARARPLSSQDRTFLHHVVKGSALQIALGRVAAKQAQDAGVKQFAAQTVKSFSKAARKLHAIVKHQNRRLPKSLPPGVKTLAKALAADHGTLVDTEYMGLIVPASMVAVNVFKQEAGNGQNPKLVSFAKTMLPKLERHYRMAVRVAHNPTKAPASGREGQAQSG